MWVYLTALQNACYLCSCCSGHQVYSTYGSVYWQPVQVPTGLLIVRLSVWFFLPTFTLLFSSLFAFAGSACPFAFSTLVQPVCNLSFTLCLLCKEEMKDSDMFIPCAYLSLVPTLPDRSLLKSLSVPLGQGFHTVHRF